MKLILLMMILITSKIIFAAKKCQTVIEPNSSFMAKITKLSDGDTVEILFNNKKEKVRLLSIDTPETHFQNNSQGLQGDRAGDMLKSLLPIGSQVRVEVEEKPRDNYCRILGVIYIDELEVNYEMIKSGFATALFFAPNLKRYQQYREAALLQRQQRFGVFFGANPVKIPAFYREMVSNRAEAPIIFDTAQKKLVEHQSNKNQDIDYFDRIYIPDPKYIEQTTSVFN